MDFIRTLAHLVLRLIVVWVVDALSLLATDAILPGFTIRGDGSTPGLVIAAAAAFMLGLTNAVIRPVILILALPFGFFIVFAAGLVVNAVVLLITTRLMPGFQIDGLFTAVFGGIVISAVNTVLTSLITVDDQDSFYQGLVERLARRQPFKDDGQPGRGLVMAEIDGLSHGHIQKAVALGYMPTVRRLIQENNYRLSRVDCGLPSQTSACQAGIMFGDNDDIPAFRWFDKDRRKLYVSGKDAPEINARYSKGHGLMRGGSSINNMMAGDAEKSILTLANVTTGSPREKSRRADDIYLLMLNPYFFMRTMVLCFGDIAVEIWEGLQQRLRDETPRLNRLSHFYPILRAATTVFMREVAAYLAILDIIRGSPAIYLTWPGYDEVAHHSGPGSDDAFRTLQQFDRVIARFIDIIVRKGARPYELIVLSDHGQSYGATFHQRYGLELREFIEQHLPRGARVVQTSGGDDGTIAMSSMSAEMDNIQAQSAGGRVGRAVVKRGQALVQRSLEAQPSAAEIESAGVTVCGSGNLAQVYFDLQPRKLTLAELDAALPGLVGALASHAGIGFVVGYDDDLAPIAIGAGGRRNLRSGEVTGIDPLLPYASDLSPVELRSEQVRRVADFPHAGDLIVNSAVFPDGTVAAMEELIGNHGGLGGEQTDAFLLHPADLAVPETRNSTDLFALLNARRSLPMTRPDLAAQPPATEAVRPWALSNMRRGLSQVKTWLSRAARVLTLDRQAFRDIAADAYMLAPALLIILISELLISLNSADGFDPADFATRLVSFPLGILAAYGAARLLGGKASYTATLQVAGFAGSAYIFELLGFIPGIAAIGHFVAMAVAFFANWVGTAEAHRLHGWRTFVLPVVIVLVATASVVVVNILVAGAVFSLNPFARELGLAP